MSSWTPLWAIDINLIVFAVVIVISIVSALGKALGKGEQAKPRPAQRPRPPAGGGPARAAQPRAGGIEDEITEFLRRAAGGRQAEPPKQPARPQPVVAQIAPEPLTRSPSKPPRRPLGSQIQESVGEHVDTSRFSRRAAELGDEVAHADDQLQARLDEKFDHDLGSLASVPGESATAATGDIFESATAATGDIFASAKTPTGKLPQTAAAGVAAMLADAQSIRQAIILSEILQRPTDRWA